MTANITEFPAYTAEKFELAHTDLGRKITLKAETVLLVYEIKGKPEKFKAYYEETIVPWLNNKYGEWRNTEQEKRGSDPNAQYPIAIYLLGHILLVFTTKEIVQPWEEIKHLCDHVTQADEEKLKWSPKAA